MSMHYPVFCYNGQFRRGADGTPLTYMLHGHIHKSEDQVLVDRFSTETRAMMRKSAHQETAQPVPCQMINCFCMYMSFRKLLKACMCTALERLSEKMLPVKQLH